MRELFKESLTVMENAFRRLEVQIEPPVKVPFKNSFVYRFEKKGIEQALLQKLARCISGLHAVDLLLANGFLQEQAVLHRTLDEMHEDILFLVAAITNDTITEKHTKFLESFYSEPWLSQQDSSQKYLNRI